ncbi:hypothetical protein M1K46_18205 [Fictibacillus sp. WQ 8-8]|uniref:hypothetical protein n=1 Tax=Fictibacillus sp. WQ 8-8 TaxID=2938788 RepID=UPI0008F1558C|nr:hypothetical protein [Fictibacillus sp. WQ 8-8]MCQ6267571.1 hypothetical protein [Fictibacillus sp. WQ 8-8]SFE48713.1 hypothetical protein SAMN05428981_10634 [Bacillus sp. OV194]
MITLCSHSELKEAKESLENLERTYPSLYEKWVHIINLTRALQFKYQYMGCLIMNEDCRRYSPEFVQGSVIRLYKSEIEKLLSDKDIEALRKTISSCPNAGYAKISLLALGRTPESLVGTSAIIS